MLSEAVGVDAIAAELLKLHALSLGLLVGNLGFLGSQSTLPDVVVDESTEGEGADSTAGGINTNLGARSQGSPLLCNRLGRFLVKGLVRCRIATV